jgi:hypothetical protein
MAQRFQKHYRSAVGKEDPARELVPIFTLVELELHRLPEFEVGEIAQDILGFDDTPEIFAVARGGGAALYSGTHLRPVQAQIGRVTPELSPADAA